MRTAVCYRGRVQGVGFRATARDLLRTLPVTGFVQNLADGSVRLEVQGSPSDTAAALARIRERLGRFIHSEDASPLPEVPAESDFVIAR